MRTFLLTLSLGLLLLNANAQDFEINWSTSLKQDRSFIENKGQFDGFAPDSDVRFAVDGGSTLILFSEEGVSYRFTRKVKNKNRKRGERTKARYIEETEVINMIWAGADPNVELKGSEMGSDMHTYAMLQPDRSETEISNIHGYQKLIYKDLYPNIDVEFVFHETEGIKYNLILHAGADPSKVRMQYSGKGNLSLDADGNLNIQTSFGDIVDHAPITNYADGGKESIPSKFTIKENTVQFQLVGHDPLREAVIDPWVTTPSFGNSNGIWDIDVDNNGNVYIYGGDTPMRLRKYDALGGLQWTYNTPWDSANYWIGTMITDPTTGDCYITAGTDPRIARINTGGTQDWNANGGAFDEYWKFSFNCDHTRLMLGGTRLTLGGAIVEGYGYVFEIDMANGSQINDQEVASVTPGPLGLVNNPNEIRAMCPSPNGKYYYMTLDTIGVFDDNLNLGYQNIHGYNFSYQVAGYGATNQGINAMAATTDFLYTQNGSVLDKRNIVDGSIVASVAIPNGVTSVELGFASVENGGLVLDSCGNVYVGSSDGVYKFDADLNQMSFQSTPGAVYDVAVNSEGELVACGLNFAASLSLNPCAPPKAVCLECLELTPVGPYCQYDAQDTLVADPGNGIWSGPGIVDEVLGIFDPAVADTGTHIIYFAPEIPLVCGIDSLVIHVNYCVELQACVDSLGYINIPNGLPPYVWSETLDTLDCSACFPAAPPIIPGCSIPPGCAVPSTYIAEFSTDIAVMPTGNWPLYVEDSQGNVLQINSLSEVPACSQGCFIVANVPDTVVACTGDSGFATVVVTGAIGNVVYSWNTVPVQNTQTAVDLAPGSYYTVTVTDDSLCVAIDSVYVTETECVGPVACVTPFGDIQADGFGPFTWYEYADSTDCSACLPEQPPIIPPCSFPPGCAVVVQGYQQFATGDLITPTGNWPIYVMDANGDSLIINALSELVACPQSCYLEVDLPEEAFTCFGQNNGEVTANVVGAQGNITYSWNTSPVQTSETATGLAAGTYVITVIDGASCEASDTVEVIQNPEITVSVSGTDSLCLGVTSGSASATASGGAGNFSYSWSTTPAQTGNTAAGLPVGTYTVTVSDEAGCTQQGTWTIEQQPSVSVNVTTGGDICLGTTDGTAIAEATNGSEPYQYSWNTDPVQNGESVSGLAPGDYQVTATDQDGCQGTAMVTIGSLPAVEADAGSTATVCLGQTTTLLATGGVSYEWSTGEFGAAIEVAPVNTTLYSVVVTDANECEATDTVTVFVVAVPLVSIEETDSVVCDVEPAFQLIGVPAGGVFSGSGVSLDGLFNPLVAGDGMHTITYTFTSVDNCEADTVVEIIVDGNLCAVIAPSVFNPNSEFAGPTDFCGNSPKNNVFSLPCLEWYPGNRMRIFDRWGRKHYDQEDYHLKPWDGGNHSDGVYYYVLEIPNEEVIKGFFHLVR